jgi:hypothetical protein
VNVAIANRLSRAAAVFRKISDEGRARVLDHELATHDEAIAKFFFENRCTSRGGHETAQQYRADEYPHGAAP